jgi:mRNA-degrading endonuclease RelE of RelBE toxin-antitoxin system
MTGRPFKLVYDAEVVRHLAGVERKYHSVIRRAVETQLRHEPEVETRNRKPLRRPVGLGATWELRCGPQNRFRVFYEPVQDRREVHILAVGVKVRNRLVIGTEEFEL